MDGQETGVSKPGGVTAIPRGSVRLGAGAPEPTRPGGEIGASVTTVPGTPEWIFFGHSPVAGPTLSKGYETTPRG